MLKARFRPYRMSDLRLRAKRKQACLLETYHNAFAGWTN